MVAGGWPPDCEVESGGSVSMGGCTVKDDMESLLVLVPAGVAWPLLAEFGEGMMRERGNR